MRPYQYISLTQFLGKHRRKQRCKQTAGHNQKKDNRRQTLTLQVILCVVDSGGHIYCTKTAEYTHQYHKKNWFVLCKKFQILFESSRALLVVESLFAILKAKPESRNCNQYADNSDYDIYPSQIFFSYILGICYDRNKDGDYTATNRGEKTRNCQKRISLVCIGSH